MTKAQLQEEILELPVEDQLEVVEAIWESLGESVEPPLPEWQRNLLDERIAVADFNPEAGTPWPEVKKQALKAL